MQEMDKHCVLHYNKISTTSLRAITTTTLVTLKNCKQIREQLGGENLHSEQAVGIPDDLDKEYFYHVECFKKFVHAKVLVKRKADKNSSSRQSKQQKAGKERGLFDENCTICKNYQIKLGQCFQKPKKLVTLEAANNVKKAAEVSKDEAMLLQIAEVDLVAKEFKT